MRSKLFVPASRPDLFAKAMAGPADVLSFDLEDAVAEPKKAEAREALAGFLRSLPERHGKTIIVRVNAIDSPHFEADLAAVVGPGLDIVNLPKPSGPDDVRGCAAALARCPGSDGIGILANIETPRALRLAREIADASERVVGLQLGWADLLGPLAIARDNPAAIAAIQLQVRLAAGEAGIWAYDGAFTDVADLEGFRREAEGARRLGFVGKSAIHPSQVPIANEVFRPSDAEIAHAQRVVQAAGEARAADVGVFTVDGKMVDPPIVRRAEGVLAVAVRLGLVGG
jgi:citrate lyase beta subunit